MPHIKLPPLLTGIEIVVAFIIVGFVVSALLKWWKDRGKE